MAKPHDGFVVLVDGAVMRLHDDCGLPDGGVLVAGDHATLFRTHGRARRAIKRSTGYARDNGFPWPILDVTKVKIRPVRSES